MPGDEARRALPSIDALVRAMDARAGISGALAARYAREAVAGARTGIAEGDAVPSLEELLEQALARHAADQQGSLRRVINASGVLLQTNLGRAPLSERATLALAEVARGYTNLEFDLSSGRRGTRHAHAREAICRVTGAEDAIVVNNNAAAVLFVLQVFASQRRVLVSRGEAVEIGGGFRIPDIVAQSGATIAEVGTTNRTYARDYAAAADGTAAAILRVHPSNFRLTGFTARPSVSELAAVARDHALLLIDDLGSGALLPAERFGLAHEPMVQESLAAGADLVLFSGDKLLGGPQCGIIVGHRQHVDVLRQHPLARALRVDKLTIAALNATLAAYLGGTAEQEIPLWRMLGASAERLQERAAMWVTAAGGGEVIRARSMVGGGTLPEEGIQSWVAALPGRPRASDLSAALRAWIPPIVARVDRERVLLDPRTVDEDDDVVVVEALSAQSEPA